MIQNLFRDRIQDSLDFSHDCPTLVCSGQINSTLLWQDCVMLSSCPFPFFPLSVSFPSTFSPLHLLSSQSLSTAPSHCSFFALYVISLYKRESFNNEKGLWATDHLQNILYVRVQREIKTQMTLQSIKYNSLSVMFLCSRSAWLTLLPFSLWCASASSCFPVLGSTLQHENGFHMFSTEEGKENNGGMRHRITVGYNV